MVLLKKLRSTLQTIAIVCVATLSFASCSENEESQNEFSNWKSRNEAYFANVMRINSDSISAARARYGQDWEKYCNRRQYLCFSRLNGSAHTTVDSIAVEIQKRGKGTASPLYTDSVRIVYRTLLMPTDEHPEGMIVDYTGISAEYDKVFDYATMSPRNFLVGSLIRGVSTALQYMHTGDRWKVIIPTGLAYGEDSGKSFPQFSTIVFELELLGIYKKGNSPGQWQ